MAVNKYVYDGKEPVKRKADLLRVEDDMSKTKQGTMYLTKSGAVKFDPSIVYHAGRNLNGVSAEDGEKFFDVLLKWSNGYIYFEEVK